MSMLSFLLVDVKKGKHNLINVYFLTILVQGCLFPCTSNQRQADFPTAFCLFESKITKEKAHSVLVCCVCDMEIGGGGEGGWW